jgi:hypothetical protein
MPETWQIFRVAWALGLALAFTVMILLIFWNGRWRPPCGDHVPELDPMPEPLGQVSDFPEGLQEAHGGVTSWVKLFAIAWAVWMIGYVVIFVMWSNGMLYLPPITAAPYSEATQYTLPQPTSPGQ